MLRLSIFAVCLITPIISAGGETLPAGMTMVSIPGGTFEMGTAISDQDPDSSFDDDEDPVHTVNISSFNLSETEVTLSQYCEFLNSVQPATSERKKWIRLKGEEYGGWKEEIHVYYSNDTYYVDSGWSDHPAVNVSWFGAAAFCDYYGLRLPTEAEWEYAAGGPNHYEYPWGDNFDDSECRYWDNRGDGTPPTMPVKSYSGNGYGLYDMAGNVREWCMDEHDRDYYANCPTKDPCNKGGTLYKILRGGSWNRGSDQSRCANRDAFETGEFILDIGFRCAGNS